MSVRPRPAALVAVLLAATLLTACGTKGGAGDSKEWNGIKTGPGTSNGTITLGAILDLSGPFAPVGADTLVGINIVVDDINSHGGICGTFKLKLDVQDSGYNLQKSVQQYDAISPNVLALTGTLGSPANAALETKFRKDQMFNVPGAWGKSLSKWEGNAIVGSTFDVDVENGMDYLLEKGLISEGDKVGHIYFQGEYGESALDGAKAIAAKHELTVVPAQVNPTDADMTSQVTRFKNAGVKAIILSAGPTQTGSVASAVAAQGFDGPVLSNFPGFSPGLLEGAAGAQLKKTFYLASPLRADLDPSSTYGEILAEKFPKTAISSAVNAGIGQGEIVKAVLEAACNAKDMTRAGLLAAKKTLSDLDTDGAVVPLNLSVDHAPSSITTNILKPADVPGGLKMLESAYKGPDANGE